MITSKNSNMHYIYMFPIYIIISAIVIAVLISIVVSKNNVEKFTDVNNIGYYVINMSHRTDKRKRILNELNEHNIKGNFIDAVIGYDIDMDKLKHHNILNDKTIRGLRRGEIGCYLSHIKTWYEFLESDYKYAIILEDDAVLIDNFLNILADIMKDLNFSFDMLYLNDNCEFHFGDDCNIGHNVTDNIFKPTTIGYGLYGYMISREGAQKLINMALPISYPIDDVTMKLCDNLAIIGYKLKNPIIFVNSIVDSDTVRIK